MINSNRRLPPPPGCPRSIYHLMISCWYVLANLPTLIRAYNVVAHVTLLGILNLLKDPSLRAFYSPSSILTTNCWHGHQRIWLPTVSRPEHWELLWRLERNSSRSYKLCTQDDANI